MPRRRTKSYYKIKKEGKERMRLKRAAIKLEQVEQLHEKSKEEKNAEKRARVRKKKHQETSEKNEVREERTEKARLRRGKTENQSNEDFEHTYDKSDLCHEVVQDETESEQTSATLERKVENTEQAKTEETRTLTNAEDFDDVGLVILSSTVPQKRHKSNTHKSKEHRTKPVKSSLDTSGAKNVGQKSTEAKLDDEHRCWREARRGIWKALSLRKTRTESLQAFGRLGSPHRHDDVTVTRSVTMDKAPNKRPADAEQTVDTFAVCSNCSRLSYNLKQCDKCGSPLSEDNASMCVSAEPKRSRLDNSITATNGNVVNGSSTNGDGSASPTATSSSAVPIPQALYVNKNASMSQESTIRPQALYVNVNNSRFTASTTTSTDTVLTTSVADGPSTASVAPRVAPPPLVSTTTTTTTTSFSTFNLPPPPPYNTGPAVTTATTAAPAPAAPTDASDDSSGGAVIGELSINNESVAMPATQIRIGTRKFLPASSVTFKEDGVLFALKDFTHAPVLLNARAIIKCQANLDQYPVFFVFLEATCIRQIRNIFNLTIDEFQENSTANLKKCITIFPNITPTTSKDTRARMTATIRKIFGHMSSRYPRPGAYLDEISNMDTIDMLFDSMRNQRTSEVIPPTPRAAQTSAQPTPNTFSSSRLVNSSGVQRGIPQSQASVYVGGDVSRMPNAATAASNNMIRFQIPAREAQPGQGTPRTMMQTVQPRPGMTARHVTPRMVNSGIRQTSTTTATVQSAAATKPATPSAGTTAPLLVVPSDNQKWREMQKDLVEGGVYHVELPNKERKYYLWDGSRLVPCLVQNTEVQLNCIYCRIGSLRADVTTAKVRADEPSGISCTIKSEHTGQQPLNLSLNMISSVTTYFDNNICVMFVSLNYNGWWTVQNSLRLGGERDPCFNPNSPEARRKHLVYMFKNVNTDQRDALLGIKHKYGGTNVFMTAPQSIIYKNIGDIMRNIWHFQGKKMNRTINYEAPIPDFISIDRAGMVADDDDDDVIMTSEEVGVKCPYTQQVMKEPVKNKLCEHNYEKIAIQEFIVRKKGNAKCPYAGCGNTKPLSMLDLIDNQELRAYIKKQQAGKT